MKKVWSQKDMSKEVKTIEEQQIYMLSGTRRVFIHEDGHHLIIEKMPVGAKRPSYQLLKDEQTVAGLDVLEQARDEIQQLLFEKATEMADAFIAKSEDGR